MPPDVTRGEPGDGPRRRRGRNLAVLFALLAFVVLVYLVTVVRMGGG